MASETVSRHDTTTIIPPDYSVKPEEKTGSREIKAAREIMVAAFGTSIPRRTFLLGDGDHSPVLKGALKLVERLYPLLDEIDRDNTVSDEIVSAANAVRAILQPDD